MKTVGNYYSSISISDFGPLVNRSIFFEGKILELITKGIKISRNAELVNEVDYNFSVESIYDLDDIEDLIDDLYR